jgi:ADP-ribosylglycohydrolase
MTTRPTITLDKIRGMFMGAFLGDSLGAPHEFNKKLPYTGLLQYKAGMNTQFQGRKELAIGQNSDDGEMCLALLRQMVQDQGYNREHVVMAYLRWANSGGWMMGKNTRALLKGVTTLRGYQGRLAKAIAAGVSQSNGAMMRCSPLALLWDNGPVVQDVNITNPTPIVVDCNLVYITALRLALQGQDGPAIFNTVKTLAQTPEVRAVMAQVEQRQPRDIVENRGWCLHALWCAMMALTSFRNYAAAMEWVIASQPGSDTDTNGCIAGALVGALIGLQAMQAEPTTGQNIEILLNANVGIGPTPRPTEYIPGDFYTLTEAAHQLTLL